MKNLRLTLKSILPFVTAALFFQACGPGKTNTEESDTSSTSEPKPPTLTKAPPSPAYETSSLTLNDMNIEESDSIFTATFDFSVNNYELGVQTEGADAMDIANSEKGQHIHFLVNNGDYLALYEPNFAQEMTSGQYVLLAFLSRSYHESIKNPDAFWVDVVTVGEPEPEEVKDIDLTAPHLFYSRPKGVYSGADTAKILLDFYLLNTTLSPDGNKVKATVNDTTEFMIDEWAPYYIENLPKGESTVKLELLDSLGTLIAGPFNRVEKKITLN